MGRKGRNRKKGPREANGKPARSKAGRVFRGEQPVDAVVKEQPHRRWLPEDKRHDQNAATVLGRLYMAGIITEEMLMAGERFGRLRREFAKIMATPVTTRSAGFAYVADGVEEAKDVYLMKDAVQETDEERRERVLTSFNEVSNAIGWLNAHGPVTRELDAVCHQDQEPANLAALLAGLAGLVRLWGLERKSRGVRGFRTEKPTWDETLHEKVEVG